MEEHDARVFWRRRTTAAPENLPGVRSAGRNQHDALPRMRREPAVFPRGTEQETFRTLRRAGSSPGLRATYSEPQYVFDQPRGGHGSFLLAEASGKFIAQGREGKTQARDRFGAARRG